MPLPTLLSQYLARRPQRIELLRHIAEQGSITRAAKSAGMSYKGAWDAIDELNNIAPLVDRSIGGKGGGGARLSPEGERVLRLYQKLQALQAQVLEAAEEASDLDLLGRLMLRTSARNQLQGSVVGIDSHGRSDIVHLALGGDLHLDAQITHDSTLSLALEIGSPVVALIKAGWLQLLAADQPAPHGHNSLSGTVQQIIEDPEGPSEVRLALSNGQTLCALSEAQHLANIGAREGLTLKITFSPSYVLLGTQL